MLHQSERKKADTSAFCLLVDLTRFVYRVVEREMWGWASWMADVFFCACFLMFVSCVFFGVLCVWGLDHVGGVGPIGLLRTLLGNLECVGGRLDRCRKEDYRVGKY